MATGRITMPPASLKAVSEKRVPKGDVLEAARIAGILAAKKTPELLPHCHPIPLDGVIVDFEFEKDAIRVRTTVKAVWKTGVEMEALTAASAALLTIFDMLKGLDADMQIGEVRVTEKTGGKSDFAVSVPKGLKAAVLVTSDGVHEGKREDTSGLLIVERLKKLGVASVEHVVLPDEKAKIRNKLLQFCEQGIRLVVTTGGTGLGPRDVTAEATVEILEREIPGVTDVIRSFGQRRTPYAMLSRGVAGVRGETLIVNLPGSARAVDESMDAIFPALLHAYHVLEGKSH
jgi:cyclic pyranopterin phosphate synthase